MIKKSRLPHTNKIRHSYNNCYRKQKRGQITRTYLYNHNILMDFEISYNIIIKMITITTYKYVNGRFVFRIKEIYISMAGQVN